VHYIILEANSVCEKDRYIKNRKWLVD